MATLGLVAGSGRLPAELAASARRAGWRVAALGFIELADPQLASQVDAFEWAYLADFGRLFEVLKAEGAADVVLAGKVPKTILWERPDVVRPDARAVAAFGALRDRKDGHTDADGTAAANQKLSLARANKVCSELKAKGLTVPCKAKGVGSSQPLVKPEKSAADKQRNRRVLVQVAK